MSLEVSRLQQQTTKQMSEAVNGSEITSEMMRYKLLSGVSMVIDKGTDLNLICWLIKFLENHILYFHVIHLLR